MDTLLQLLFSKIDEEQRTVYGIAAVEELDRSNEIFDYETSKPYIKAWSDDLAKATDGANLGNVRAMHQRADGTRELIAAGHLTQLVFNDEKKRVEVAAKITDDGEWAKCLAKTYTGFSFGGTYAGRWKDEVNKTAMRYTAKPTELSLADLPCGPGATFIMVKAAGQGSLVEPLGKAVAKRDDTSPSPIGGPYADETNKKYPIGDPAHVRNALSRWGDASNRAKYSAADQKKIGARIEAAKKKFGIGDDSSDKIVDLSQLADALGKIDAIVEDADFRKAAGVDRVNELKADRHAGGLLFLKIEATRQAGRRLEKGLYGVGQLASAIATIDCITRDAEWEAEAEADDSKVPGKLAVIRSQLGDVLVQMAQEEVDELSPEDNVEKLSKLLADLDALVKTLDKNELSKALGPENMKHVQAIHDKSVELGASHNGKHDDELEKDGWAKGGDDGEASEKFTKAVASALAKLGVGKDAAALTKAAGAQGGTILERLEKLEAQPAGAANRASSLSAEQLLKLGAPAEPFRPSGLGVGGGEGALKAAGVLELIKVARASAVPQGPNGTFVLAEGKGNLAKLA